MYLKLFLSQALGFLPQVVIIYLVVRVAVHQELKSVRKGKKRRK